MPDLLETLADKNALHLMDLTAAVQDDVERLKAGREPRSLKADLSAARFLAHDLSLIVFFVDTWRAHSESFLREGLDSHELQIIARSGLRHVRGFLSIAEVVAQLWDQLEHAGAPATEVTEARESLASLRGRVLAAKPWFDRLEKLAARNPPDIDPALIEKGAKAIREGRFKTTDQIRRSLHETSS